MLRRSSIATSRRPVALAMQGQDRVGTDLELAGHAPREVHAQERVARVRDRVDHAADQVALRRQHAHVLAPEGHDPWSVQAVTHPRHPVGLQAGTHDQAVHPVDSTRGLDVDSRRATVDPGDRRRQEHSSARVLDVLGVGLGHGEVVGDRGRRGVQREQAGRVRLDLGDPGALHPRQPRYVVVPRGHLERVETSDLRAVHGDDELPALDVRQPAVGAVLAQHQPAARAQLGLEAAGPVVEAGVHDTGVVPGLVDAEPVLLLEHDDRRTREPARDLAGHRETHDAAADDAEGALAHRPPSSPRCCRQSTVRLRWLPYPGTRRYHGCHESVRLRSGALWEHDRVSVPTEGRGPEHADECRDPGGHPSSDDGRQCGGRAGPGRVWVHPDAACRSDSRPD